MEPLTWFGALGPLFVPAMYALGTIFLIGVVASVLLSYTTAPVTLGPGERQPGAFGLAQRVTGLSFFAIILVVLIYAVISMVLV